jgi:hypothetical protein
LAELQQTQKVYSYYPNKTTTLYTMSESKSSNAKIAKQIADRRLVEYFVIVSSIEQHSSAIKTNSNSGSGSGTTTTSRGGGGANKSSSPQKKEPSNGDISFSDWKTEGSYEQDEEDIFAAYQFKPTITARYPLHDHPDNPLHDNVIFFCHPSGSIQLRMEEYMPKVRYRRRRCCCCFGVCVCVCGDRSIQAYASRRITRALVQEILHLAPCLRVACPPSNLTLMRIFCIGFESI